MLRNADWRPPPGPLNVYTRTKRTHSIPECTNRENQQRERSQK